MRKTTIGMNPLDAVVPDLSGQAGEEQTKTGKGSETNGSSVQGGKRVAPRPAKERLTVHISVPLIERAKNTVFWTPGLTLADLGERALEALVSDLEKNHGGPFEARPHELKGGRPLK